MVYFHDNILKYFQIDSVVYAVVKNIIPRYVDEKTLLDSFLVSLNLNLTFHFVLNNKKRRPKMFQTYNLNS